VAVQHGSANECLSHRSIWDSGFITVPAHSRSVAVKPGLDGAWLGSFYVITDVTDKESYSNAPCNRPGAARSVIGGARLVGTPQKRFSHDPQRDSARQLLRLHGACSVRAKPVSSKPVYS
jgi:hypothetical protein